MTDSLIRAAKRSDLVGLREAIASGANLNVEDSQGWTPLMHAANAGSPAVVRALIGAGVDVNHGGETGFTALFVAVLSGHVESVRALLDAGARIVPVDGIELRNCVTKGASHSQTIIEMLDKHRSELQGTDEST